MPEPAVQLARAKAAYVGADNQPYELKVVAAWALSGIGPSLQVLTPQQLGTIPPLPAGWIPRHVYAETTDGTDADGNPKVYRRKFVVNEADIGTTGTLFPGATFIFEGCTWQVRGRVGEKHYDRG